MNRQLPTPGTAGNTAAAAPAAPSAPAATRARRVIDASVRMFHWLFAACFTGAWLTADGERWRALHESLGYAAGGLLLFRLVYGWVGPRPARWGSLAGRLSGAGGWLRRAAQVRHPAEAAALPWRQGQNLLVAAAVAGLLGLAGPLVLSGWALQQDLGGEWLEELHEALANGLGSLALLHLGLILGLGLWRGQNLARPMWTGTQAGPGPDLVAQPRRWLAALMAAAVLAWLLRP